MKEKRKGGGRRQAYDREATRNKGRRTNASHLLHTAQHTRLRHIRHVDEDVVRRVAVQRRTQALLVEVVANETDAAAEDEQTVERADLDVLVGFFGREGAAVAEEVDEADGDAAIDVQDELERKKGSDKQNVVGRTERGDIQCPSWRW